MCACNRGNKPMPRRSIQPARGTRGPDAIPMSGPMAQMAGGHHMARQTNIQPQPLNIERIRVEKLRKQAIIQARNQNG